MALGSTGYCSAPLLYAILAYACHFSERPQTRSDPANPSTAGDEYFAEAKASLDATSTSALTTVQALAS